MTGRQPGGPLLWLAYWLARLAGIRRTAAALADRWIPGVKGNELSKNGLENALTTALEKAKVYAQDSNESYHRDLLFPETVDRLLDETESMPTDWTIDKRELQFCYVLRHAHGRRSMPVAYDLHESEETAPVEQSANQPARNTTMTSPNRSEILFVYDAQDCNPNGNPIGDNRPRR